MHISLAPEILFTAFGILPVTNTMLTAWLAMAVLGAVALLFYRQREAIPGRFQGFLETIFEALLTFLDSVTQDHGKSRKFLPLVATIFLFVITANWMGIFPGVGSVGIFSAEGGSATGGDDGPERSFVPLFRSAYSDLNNTLAIALITVIAVQAFGVLSIGMWRYAGRFISFRGPIQFFVGLLESIGELAKILSFSFRLFGNIFAGEVLLVVVASLIPWLVPIPFLGLELFVGFIQALVFAMLALVFLTMATTEFEH